MLHQLPFPNTALKITRIVILRIRIGYNLESTGIATD
jgi:hypothetical protein